MSKVEIIEFNGKIYRRYPNANGWMSKWYFQIEGNWRRKTLLHRDVWEFYNGKIPKGYHIHHIDENPLNNSIENLKCLSQSEHRKMHSDPSKMSNMANKSWECRNKFEKTCVICSKKYEVYRASQSRYCSDSCVSTGRYKSGKDNLEKECQECKKMFYYNKYKPKVSCSRKCADAISSKTKARKKLNGELWKFLL